MPLIERIGILWLVQFGVGIGFWFTKHQPTLH